MPTREELLAKVPVWSLFAAAVAAYAITVPFGFAYDDVIWVIDNPLIRSLKRLPEYFAAGQQGGRVYRPVTVLSFALEFPFAGLRSWPYHLTNILLHGIVTVLVYRVLAPLGTMAAWLAAILFAVLPIHDEVVATVTGRSDLLAALFGLLALRYIEKPVAAAFCLLLGLFAKESVIAIPAIAAIFLLPAWPQLSRTRRGAIVAALLAAAGIYVLVRTTAGCCTIFLEGAPYYEQENPLVAADLATRIRTSVMRVGQDLAACLVPFHVVTRPVLSWADPRLWLWSAVPVLALVTGFLLRRQRPNLLRGTLWFLLAIAPVSNLLLLIGVLRADRLLYLPSIGACWMMGEIAAYAFTRNRRLAVAGFTAFAAMNAIVAVDRASDWRDQESILVASARRNPSSAHARYLLGDFRRRTGNCDDAVHQFRAALDVAPHYAAPHVGIALCMQEAGRYREARSEFAIAAAAHPADPNLNKALANICAALADWNCVAATMERYLQANPKAASDKDAAEVLANARAQLRGTAVR